MLHTKNQELPQETVDLNLLITLSHSRFWVVVLSMEPILVLVGNYLRIAGIMIEPDCHLRHRRHPHPAHPCFDLKLLYSGVRPLFEH